MRDLFRMIGLTCSPVLGLVLTMLKADKICACAHSIMYVCNQRRAQNTFSKSAIPCYAEDNAQHCESEGPSSGDPSYKRFAPCNSARATS